MEATHAFLKVGTSKALLRYFQVLNRRHRRSCRHLCSLQRATGVSQHYWSMNLTAPLLFCTTKG
jgi:hypothetical protein